ncbi:nuclear transport factor 2 family protein, partial [Brucella sp. BO2]
VENVFAALGAVWDDYTFTLDRLLDAGSDVVAIGNYTARNKATGKAMDVRVVHVWGVADGKIRRFEQFTDTLRVAEAMRD